jgi:hypothetical protein
MSRIGRRTVDRCAVGLAGIFEPPGDRLVGINWPSQPTDCELGHSHFLSSAANYLFAEAQAMTQQSAKFSPRRIMIVCLVALVLATSIAIAFGAVPERTKTNIRDAFVNTTLGAAALAALDRLQKIARKH